MTAGREAAGEAAPFTGASVPLVRSRWRPDFADAKSSSRRSIARIRCVGVRTVLHRRVAVVAVALSAATACTPSGPSAGPTANAPSLSAPGPVAVTTSSGDGPSAAADRQQAEPQFSVYAVPAGSRPHDVAPAADGRVWYTAQGAAALGVLDAKTGATHHVPLGRGSAPHGVIVGPDGAAWVTDGGLNALARVDPSTFEVVTFPLPRAANANLNTAAFDGNGVLWFTGQSGFYGRMEPSTRRVEVFEAPRGRGPYGITTAPDGTVWFASLAGSYISQIAPTRDELILVDVPSPDGGARRIWSDSSGGLWVTEWFAGKLAHYDPAAHKWREWRLPGDDPQPYAVYVDEEDVVWVTDFGANSLVRFDPQSEHFRLFPFPTPDAQVRQLLGREGAIWGAGSATDTLFVLRTR